MTTLLSSDIVVRHRVPMIATTCVRRQRDSPNRWLVDLGRSTIFEPNVGLPYRWRFSDRDFHGGDLVI